MTSNHNVFQMSFAKLCSLLLNKATRKGRTPAEGDEVMETNIRMDGFKIAIADK